MNQSNYQSIELLAPAGSPEALIAALESGADAVYAGLKDFNARKRAKNFTIDEFKYAVNYVHHHNKKIYLTLNTLMFDHELEQVIKILNLAQGYAVDAIIVQDIGLIQLIRTYYPSLTIHASTQTFCHNSMHAQFLKDLGVSRIILPRELSLNEIKSIQQKVPCEYEVFIHGAMCFSFSGCCLFSSYLFGQSGNRGRCLQPCRYPFTTGSATRYPFSMKDLALGPSIADYINAGITKFKIEGRLKSTWYINEVVSYYRTLIDSLMEGKSFKNEPPSLRSTTKGYMCDSSYDKLVDAKTVGVAGAYIGTVTQVKNKFCIISTSHPLQKGLRLRIVDNSGKNIYEGTLLDYKYDKNRHSLEWYISLNSKPPLYVYIIGESKSDNALKKLKAIPFKPYSVNIQITINSEFTISAIIDTFTVDYTYTIPIQKAIKQGLSPNTIQYIFSQTAHFPFVATVSVTMKDSIFIPLSQLKQLRRQFYDMLYKDYIKHRESINQQRESTIIAHIETIKKNNATIKPENTTFIWQHFEKVQTTHVNSAFIELPVFVPENTLDDTITKIKHYMHNGFKHFIIPTYGWLEFFKGKDVVICAGDFCYCVNSFTYEVYKNNAVSYFTISGDMDSLDITTRYYNGFIQFHKPKIYLVTRLRIPDAVYTFKHKQYCPQHYAHYDVLSDCE
ncbi:MAG: U32 family peptidase [Spirochaetota bacterium]